MNIPHSAFRIPHFVSWVLAGVLLFPALAWAQTPAMRWWFPENYSTYGPHIDRLFTLILWVTGIMFVLVEGALVWFLIRYRARQGQSASYVHGNVVVEIIWTVIPALIVLYLALGSQRVWSHVRGTPPAHQLEVRVTAEQFAWNMTYPGPDGMLDTPDDLQTINQLHIPLDQVVLVHVTSKDVIHSFFLPQFRVKLDAVPGLTGRLWLQATKTGQGEIACAELCGLGHYRMRGFFTVESLDAFQAWLAQVQAEQTS